MQSYVSNDLEQYMEFKEKPIKNNSNDDDNYEVKNENEK